jgi:hypothetical protein
MTMQETARARRADPSACGVSVSGRIQIQFLAATSNRDPTVTAIPVVSNNTRVTNSDRLMEGMSDWQEAATMVTKARARANSLVLM